MKRHETQPAMTLARFERLVDAHGADPARWPAADRATAQAFARSEAARPVLEAARALDAVLDRSAPVLPDAAAFARALAAVPAAPVARRRGLGWIWSGLDDLRLASGAGLAMAACAGVVFGLNLTHHLTADIQAEAVLYQATLAAMDDTEALGADPLTEGFAG